MALLICLIQGVVFGAITRYVADSKGYDGGFWWGFFLGVIGLMVVGFRPTVNSQPAATLNSAYWDKLQDNASGSTGRAMWHCVCGTENPVALSYCVRCRRTRSEANAEKKEKCPHCGAMNRSNNVICFACGRALQEIPALPEVKPAQDAPSTERQQEAISLLESLNALHQRGILTDDEFADKKKQILSRI